MTLAANHYDVLHTGSALSDEVITERGYATLDGPTGYDDLKRLGFSTAQAKLRPGLLLPLYTTDGTQPLTIYRPDQPNIDARGKPRKYLLPKGASVRLDCPPRCREALANPHVPVWITEGQKKADALASRDATALALLGVWNFKGKNAFGGTTLLADFDYIAWQGREVRLVFDSDVISIPGVQKALDRLTEHLSRKGAAVRQVYLPAEDGAKVGVDDYLAAGHTLQDLEALIEAPRPQPQAAPNQIKVLDTAPARMTRPLALIDGKAYAAIWPYVEVTKTEDVDKDGKVYRLKVPEVTREQRLFVLRDDGVIFGEEGGDQTFDQLGIEVHLPEIPLTAKGWAIPAVRSYRQGARPDPVAVFGQITDVVQTFIDFNRSLAAQETMAELVGCFVMASWFLDAFTVVGYLWPNGEKGSGKTQVLTLIAELAYLGQVVLAGGSYACLRDFADYGATLAFDDAENVMDLKRGDPDKRALLLAGNRRGNSIAVKEAVSGKEWRTRHVQTFCPRLFSAIRLPDPVLASRTIIVPLIRTADPKKANADPLDYRLWPTPREDLVNNLWAMALSRMPELPRWDAHVADTATLMGRNLEPWRAILAVAHWLTECGVKDLDARMHALSHAYQTERPDLEPPDLTAWVIKALCHYATNATSATIQAGEQPKDEWIFPTKDVKQALVEILQDEETGIDPTSISTDRIGRLLGKLRLKKKPRTVASAPRQWELTQEELRQWLVSYGMPLPPSLFPPPPSSTTSGTSGTTTHATTNATTPPPPVPSGTSGTSGIVAQAASANGALPHVADAPCPRCASTQPPSHENQDDGSTLIACSDCHYPLTVVPF